jgi:signal transduction histidine kinase
MGLRTWFCRHPAAADVLVAALFVGADTFATRNGASWWPAHPTRIAWVMLAVQAVAVSSLAFRRRAPLAVIAVLAAFTLAISLVISPAGLLTPAHAGNVWAPYATIVAAYGPFYYGKDGKDRRVAFAAVGMLTIIAGRPWDPSAAVISLAIVRTVPGPVLALYFTARRAMVQTLTERAERAERERYLLAEQARADERARLAAEMHDVVTHRVSLMVLQAGALGVTATDEATRRAAEELRAAGCQALEELRDVVGILRTSPDGDPDGASSAAGLAALAAESTAVGTPAELAEEGDPALASPVVGRTVYRIVREALTNVRKHAPGAHVLVQIGYGESQVRLTVTNTPAPGRPGSGPATNGAGPLAHGAGPGANGAGPGANGAGLGAAGPGLGAHGFDVAAAGSGLAATGSGLGLASLRQRVEVVHGTMLAGRTPDGGYRLEATLPAYVPTAEPAG